MSDQHQSSSELHSESEEDKSVDQFEEQPRVPLHVDPEFVDPKQAKYKFGIVYLSCVPEGCNVKILREIMGQFGDIGRIFLQPEKNNKKYRTYVEGWVEFKKKRVAKDAAKSLNGTPLEYGRKHCKLNGQIWCVKYLHRFKWAHLMEQLAHDKASRDQKRRYEMGQAKEQVNFYQKMTERSQRLKRLRSKSTVEHPTDTEQTKALETKQNKPRRSGEELTIDVDKDLLGCIFRKVSRSDT